MKKAAGGVATRPFSWRFPLVTVGVLLLSSAGPAVLQADEPHDIEFNLAMGENINKFWNDIPEVPNPLGWDRVELADGTDEGCALSALRLAKSAIVVKEGELGAVKSVKTTLKLSKDLLSLGGFGAAATAVDLTAALVTGVEDPDEAIRELERIGIKKATTKVVGEKVKEWVNDADVRKLVTKGAAKVATSLHKALTDSSNKNIYKQPCRSCACSPVNVEFKIEDSEDLESIEVDGEWIDIPKLQLRMTVTTINCDCKAGRQPFLLESYTVVGVAPIELSAEYVEPGLFGWTRGYLLLTLAVDGATIEYWVAAECCTGGGSGDDDGSGTHLGDDDGTDAYGLGGATSRTTGTGSFTVSVDNAETCDYGGSTVVVDGGDPTTTDGGDGGDDGEDGGTTPPGPTPTGLRPPGGGPTIVVTPGSTPDDEEDEPATTRPPPDDPVDDWPVYLGKVTRSTIEAGQTVSRAAANALIHLGPVEDAALPVAENAGTRDPESGHADPPTKVMTDENGEFEIAMGGGDPSSDDEPRTVVIQADASAMDGAIQKVGSKGCMGLASTLRDDLKPYLASCVDAPNGESYATYRYPDGTMVGDVPVEDLIDDSEYEYCGTIAPQPTSDPFSSSSGSWGQDYADQWAVRRVGFTSQADSAWRILDEPLEPVIVAVVDTGLDWNHLDMSWDNVWRNPGEIPGNGIDDDGNGYVDDLVGWDFFDQDNHPWDTNGHGTFVTGLIAATRDNGVGIAGIAPNAKIMILRALDAFGHTRATKVAEAIFYAADNGARIINVSVESPGLTRMEQEAVDYARSQGALVVVAAGNEAVEARGPARLEGALVVAATDTNDARAPFSNWGSEIDLAAPGVDVLSLRARRTDFSYLMPGVEYELGMGWVGDDQRYYRSAGTSFAAPIVSGTAALLLGRWPELTVDQLERMLLQSAEDVDIPGKDRHTGYGVLDARAALAADPEFFIEAEISGVGVVVRDGTQLIQVSGTADSDRFGRAWLELGVGKAPEAWKPVGEPVQRPVRDDLLGEIPARELAGSAHWKLRVTVERDDGRRREGWFEIDLE
ncbi:MAG TPA: S8 family peptidase [Thermoanaerobaculia bacterium]|nr:S8 family peptidase [Thermoanaerobaculia bacterium]